MAETLRIDIDIGTLDNTEPGVSNVTKNLTKMEKAAKDANNATKDANDALTELDKQAEKAEKSVSELEQQAQNTEKAVSGFEQQTEKTEKTVSEFEQQTEKTGNTVSEFGQQVEKTEKTVSQFDIQAQKVEKSLAEWAKEDYEILLEAKDKISSILPTIKIGLTGLTSKTWRVTMRAIDLVTAPVRGILNLLSNPIFQAGAVLGISFSVKDTIDTYQDFEAAMSQVQAISGASGSDFDNLTEKAKEMGATTKFNATEAAEAFNYMAMAGWKSEDMLNGIEGIMSLAAASGEDLGTTSDIVTDALTAFGLRAADAGHFADVMAQASANANTNVGMLGESFKYVAPVAGAMKYSIEDVSLALGLMANSSVKGSMAGTALKTSLANMASPTDKMAQAMEKYNISLTDSKGNMKTLKGVLDNLRSSMGDLSEAEQTAAASTIFGKEAMAGMLAIINASGADYKKLTEAVNNADGASARMAETMQDNLAGCLEELSGALDSVKLSLGERFAPYVGGMAEWLTDIMPDIDAELDKLMDLVDRKVNRIKRKFNEISSTAEWKDADLFGKIHIAWDEFIAEPFVKWWSSTGKAKFAEFAEDIGEGIGTGLKVGIMTLLGISIGETVDEGVSIGASFAKGFTEGFDFDAVSEKLWQGFGSMLSSAGKLLPGGESADLSSILSAVILGKIATPFFGVGKGAFSIGKALFGTNVSTGTSLMGSFVGSATSGTGLLGKSSMLAINLGAGEFANGATMSAAGLSATGLAAGAGAIAAGTTLISSALDAYTAIKSEDTDEKKAYGESAAWKAGGVAGGAAIGAAFGSIIPGIGTGVGALVGAGVGGIAGWIQGNKAKEEYKKQVEEMEKEAEQAQKVFEATGLSIEDVTFKNKALTEAMNDTEVSAEELALMIQEECANVAKEAFGDIALSLEEVQKLASEITFADMADELDIFAQATSDAEASLNDLQSSIRTLKKESWKIGLDMELSEDEKEDFKTSIDVFINSSLAYIEDEQYEATVALKLLSGENTDTSSIDSYYDELRSKVEDLNTKIEDSMKIVLDGDVIKVDKEKALQSILDAQNQITELINQLASTQFDSQLQTMQIKYDGSALDLSSFSSVQEELQAYVASASEQYESALTTTLNNYNLAKENGNMEQAEYDEKVAAATEDYHKQLSDMKGRVMDFNLQSIVTAWDSELENILPDIEGTTTEKLEQALNNALALHPDVTTWTSSDVISWLGLDKLDLDTIQQVTIASELMQTALAVPEGTKEEITKKFLHESLPSAEGIKSFVPDSFCEVTESGWDEAGKKSGNTYNESVAETLSLASSLLRGSMQSALNVATANPFSVSPTVNVTPSYNVSKTPSFLTEGTNKKIINGYSLSGKSVDNNAAGGYVSGGPQLSWLAEEGYGEFVIPTNPSRRTRALELYAQAGKALGVSAHAAGGYVGGSILSDTAANYNLSSEANKYASTIYNNATTDNYNEELSSTYEPVSVDGQSSAVNSSVQVNVNLTPEFVINASDGKDEETIMQVIRRHMKEMADELGGEIAGKLDEVFSNMPLKEA